MNLDMLAKDTLEGRRSFQKFVEHTSDEVKKQFPTIKSLHEGLAFLLENFEEFKKEVFKKTVDKETVLKNLALISSCCQRLSEDVLKTKNVNLEINLEK
jgi:DNA-directed RNA polymerase subunit N (RpoN/RPB10)